MTYTSICTAATTLLTAQIPSIVTIAREDEHRAGVAPEECPLVLLAEGDGEEFRLAGGIGGWKQRDWWLELHVWARSESIALGADTFTDLVDAIEHALRGDTRMGGTGDTATTQVMSANERMKRTTHRPKQGPGGIYRGALLSTRISEVMAA